MKLKDLNESGCGAAQTVIVRMPRVKTPARMFVGDTTSETDPRRALYRGNGSAFDAASLIVLGDGRLLKTRYSMAWTVAEIERLIEAGWLLGTSEEIQEIDGHTTKSVEVADPVSGELRFEAVSIERVGPYGSEPIGYAMTTWDRDGWSINCVTGGHPMHVGTGDVYTRTDAIALIKALHSVRPSYEDTPSVIEPDELGVETAEVVHTRRIIDGGGREIETVLMNGVEIGVVWQEPNDLWGVAAGPPIVRLGTQVGNSAETRNAAIAILVTALEPRMAAARARAGMPDCACY